MNPNVIAPYKPLDWHFAPLRDKSLVLLLTGSAGGGKSRCAGEKVHAYLKKYPGATGLMLRKAREFASKSIVPFMRYSVISDDPTVQFKKSDMLFAYDNGSVLLWGGMKDDSQREALRSIGQDGALDIVWIEEATAFTLTDFEEILGRMRGKAASWRQVILTTNPDSPNHWINQRLIIGQGAKTYYSSALDNFYNPPDYIDTLNRLSGIQGQRLRDGLWVQAEGAIYDTFSYELNVSENAEFNPAWSIMWGVDDGYVYGQGQGTISYHPRVILFGQVTPTGGVNIFHEYYKTMELSERSIDNCLDFTYPKPDVAYVDSSAAELKARIWERGFQTVSATHRVSEGIKNVRRLMCDGNNVRMLQIHPRCTNLIQELQSYRYDIERKGDGTDVPPLKVDDHGPDALRYMTWHLRYGN